MFFIPLDRSKEEDYQIGYSFNEGAITDGTQVEAYDVGLDGNAKAICTYMDAEDKTNVPLAGGYSIVVEKVYQKADSDGFYHTAIRGWSESGFVDLLLKDGISIEKFNDIGELSTRARGLRRLTAEAQIIIIRPAAFTRFTTAVFLYRKKISAETNGIIRERIL